MENDTGATPWRAFFREAAARFVGPLADYIEGTEEPLRDPIWLRPTGASEEERFLDACQRCGACVEICPAHAIFPLTDSYGAAVGTPAVDADRAACVVCEGLHCTTVCHRGALLELTTRPTFGWALRKCTHRLRFLPAAWKPHDPAPR